jgi:hypothetical protein
MKKNDFKQLVKSIVNECVNEMDDTAATPDAVNPMAPAAPADAVLGTSQPTIDAINAKLKAAGLKPGKPLKPFISSLKYEEKLALRKAIESEIKASGKSASSMADPAEPAGIDKYNK